MINNCTKYSKSAVEIWDEKTNPKSHKTRKKTGVLKDNLERDKILEDVYIMSRNGSSLDTIAGYFGVTYGTLRKYLEDVANLDLRLVYDKAKAQGVAVAEDILYTRILQKKELKDLQFFLSSRAAESWGAKQETPMGDIIIQIGEAEKDV